MSGVVKRIALYGGSFDPVHTGHTSVARNLSELFALDEVLFIPAHVAPHKRDRKVTPALQRYAMLALATQNEPRFRVSSIELDAPERPYTVETLGRLQETLGREARLFFVMGADSWTEIRTWREWERVLEMAEHIVVTRPGYELDASHVTEAVRERIVDVRGATRETVERELAREEGRKIYLTDAVELDVSATAIREAVRKGAASEMLERFVAPEVADFIRKYRLYRNTHETESFEAGSQDEARG
ncbi:MAG TPA: nicotinate-nucleotide adenylyltransferase [Pyrinomonadaceae bacterium]|nr:nicotinate-nucleotide adenylyltransferase [Pyrinomonadaceae bacterium]